MPWVSALARLPEFNRRDTGLPPLPDQDAENSSNHVCRRLKPARESGNKRLIGTAKAVP